MTEASNRRVRLSTIALLALACSGFGCGRTQSNPQPSAASPQPEAVARPLEQARKYEPPRLEFKAPQPWQSRKEGAEPIPPPEIEPEAWRVLVTQNEPLQIKTPKWQTLPPKENVEVAMPEGSTFRCVVSPLLIDTDANDFNTKLKAWVLKRVLTCSDDDWHHWTEYSHSVRVTPEGQRDMLPVPEALLRERMPDGSIKHTFVLLRSDKEIRDATTGPPRILHDRIVDDD